MRERGGETGLALINMIDLQVVTVSISRTVSGVCWMLWSEVVDSVMFFALTPQLGLYSAFHIVQ